MASSIKGVLYGYECPDPVIEVESGLVGVFAFLFARGFYVALGAMLAAYLYERPVVYPVVEHPIVLWSIVAAFVCGGMALALGALHGRHWRAVEDAAAEDPLA